MAKRINVPAIDLFFSVHEEDHLFSYSKTFLIVYNKYKRLTTCRTPLKKETEEVSYDP